MYCINERKLSENTIHSRLNALKFYYEQVLKKEQFFFSIPRPKKAVTLPKFFSQKEIKSIIKSVVNLKHRTMLMLCYSTGMRVSEVVTLRVSQIMAHRNCILIERAKGKKNRLVQLSPVLLIALRAYASQFKIGKEGYLFPGQQKETPYSSRSLQKILQEAKLKAGIIKPGSVHALRHSFYYVRNGDRSNDNEFTKHKSSILKIKEFFNRIIHFERTQISEIELRKFQSQILDLDNKLNNRSFLKRIMSVFR